MSILSRFVEDIEAGILGGSPPPLIDNPSSPLAPALNDLGKSVANASSAAASLGVTLVNGAITAHVGTAGTAAADLLLASIIQAAASKMTTPGAAQAAVSTAASGQSQPG